MSNASPIGSDRPSPGPVAESLQTVARQPVQTASFWTAVLIPVAYPWLLFGGVGGRELFLLLGLLALNAVTLVLGRDHKRDHA